MATRRSPLSRLALGAVLLMLACSLSTCKAQGVSVKYQNLFQCWPGVDVAGIPISTVTPSASPDDCARKCLTTAGCTMFSITRGQWCNLKTLPFESLYGSTRRDDTVMATCLVKGSGGSLPSPQNAMCFPGQNVAGSLIANTESVSDSVACANLCITVPGCSYSVFKAGGLTGNGPPLCQLKSSAFTGTEPQNVTQRDPSVTGICFRAIPAPQVQDPLMVVAGPVPFKISSQQANRCLRSPTGPYHPGMVLYFSSDCGGIDTLWTYDSGTQILTHYPSGLCLAPTDAFSGAVMVLSSNCGASSGNQIISRASNSLFLILNSRWLLPAGAGADEGTSMVAVSNGMNPYNFFPSPLDTFQCYPGVGIPGNCFSTTTNIPDRNTCSKLCLANSTCQMFVYDNWKACRLFTAPFNTGGSVKNPNFEASCISIMKGSVSPSPANFLCYDSLAISGTQINRYPATAPLKCSEMCAANPACTYAYYTLDGYCVFGKDALTTGNQADNRLDPMVLQGCLLAPGAPDTIFNKAYKCFPGADINGDNVQTVYNVLSVQDCARLCEESSDICTLASWKSDLNSCELRNYAFGWGSHGVRDSTRTACLRTPSGGSLNSPLDFLCYSAQMISGTQLSFQVAVADSTSCATLCANNPQCTFATYHPVQAGTCNLMRDAFYGTPDMPNDNRADGSTALCLRAPGAPEVFSSFGMPLGQTASEAAGNATKTNSTSAGSNSTDGGSDIDFTGGGFGQAMGGRRASK